MSPPPLSALRERLMAWASEGPRREEMVQARKDYFRDTGEVREDEPCFDAFMDAFADWFLCDRTGDDGLTAAGRFVRDHQGVLPEEELAPYREFTRTRVGVWAVQKFVEGGLDVRDLLGKEKLRVSERRKLAGVGSGDVFNARLVRYADTWWFTGMPLFHPAEVRKLVTRIARAHRGRTDVHPAALLRELAGRRLKVDRYRKVPPAQHYADLAPGRRFLFW